jgi:hypothetical protein
MLVQLSVVELRYHAVLDVVSGGVTVVEVAERYGCHAIRCTLAASSRPPRQPAGAGRPITPPASPSRPAGRRDRGAGM